MTDPIEQQLRKTMLGQLIAEIAKFGGDDKQHASQLATILLPHIDTYAARRAVEARKEALQWALNDYNMPDTDTASNLKDYIAELNHKEPKV